MCSYRNSSNGEAEAEGRGFLLDRRGFGWGKGLVDWLQTLGSSEAIARIVHSEDPVCLASAPTPRTRTLSYRALPRRALNSSAVTAAPERRAPCFAPSGTRSSACSATRAGSTRKTASVQTQATRWTRTARSSASSAGGPPIPWRRVAGTILCYAAARPKASREGLMDDIHISREILRAVQEGKVPRSVVDEITAEHLLRLCPH